MCSTGRRFRDDATTTDDESSGGAMGRKVLGRAGGRCTTERLEEGSPLFCSRNRTRPYFMASLCNQVEEQS